MDALECIRTRRSIRAFKPETVSREILTEVIDTAGWSPSYKNSQPWEVAVLSGAKKEALSAHIIEIFESGEAPSPDIAAPTSWPETEQARIDHLYSSRAEATGIDLAAPEMVRKAKKANFSFYRAPHAIYLFQESSLTPWSLFDLGLFAQSLMLAAHARGLGTVPQAFATDYARQIKQFLSIPATKRLVLGISIGYPNPDSPVNALRTERVGADETITWHE